MNIFTRLVAVSVGLVNLVILAGLEGGDITLRRGEVMWEQALPAMLAVIVAGLLTSEIILRWFKQAALAEEFSEHCGVVLVAVCLGGTLMGGLLVLAQALAVVLVEAESETTTAAVLAVLIYGLFGALYGAALGFLEGMFLSVPLATILGLFRSRD